MNAYCVIVTHRVRHGDIRITRRSEMDVVTNTSCEALLTAVRAINPLGDFTASVKCKGERK